MSEEHIPQLKMIIRDVQAWSQPPLPDLPDRFLMRASQPGDNTAWCTIITESFKQEMGEKAWQSEIISKEGYRPERVFFIVEKNSGEPAATASAMRVDGEQHGYLHFVGTRPAFTGMKLGGIVTAKVTRDFKEAGCVDALLKTDSFRIPAILTYLRLGYIPLIDHPKHVEIWDGLRRELKLEFEVLHPEA